MPWSEFAYMPQHLVCLKLYKPWPFNLFMAEGHIHNSGPVCRLHIEKQHQVLYLTT